jgi:predicted 3-demethylubiquinone-9 3-methyltransferase (glyoxalase superfamily)
MPAPAPRAACYAPSFELEGVQFTAMNGGPHFKFTEAISLLIHCGSQEEVDYFWEKLGEGGQYQPMRLAQGQIRPVLAGHARPAAGTQHGP